MSHIECSYSEKNLIGKGSFGKVYGCNNNDKLVIKIPNEQISYLDLQFNPDDKSPTEDNKFRMLKKTIASSFLNEENYFRHAITSKIPDKMFEYVIKLHQCDLTHVVMDRCDYSLGNLPHDVILNNLMEITMLLMKGINYLYIFCDHSHNDIKPDNIGVSINIDNTLSLKFLDMGSSQNILKETKVSEFTPHYASPHTLSLVQIDFVRDLWAIGCTLFELVSGVALFNDMTTPQIIKHVFNMDIRWISYITGYISFDELQKLQHDNGIKNKFKPHSKFCKSVEQFTENLKKLPYDVKEYVKAVIFDNMSKSFDSDLPDVQFGGGVSNQPDLYIYDSKNTIVCVPKKVTISSPISEKSKQILISQIKESEKLLKSNYDPPVIMIYNNTLCKRESISEKIYNKRNETATSNYFVRKYKKVYYKYTKLM